MRAMSFRLYLCLIADEASVARAFPALAGTLLVVDRTPALAVDLERFLASAAEADIPVHRIDRSRVTVVCMASLASASGSASVRPARRLPPPEQQKAAFLVASRTSLQTFRDHPSFHDHPS